MGVESMLSTMQDFPLTIPAIARHGGRFFGDRVVVTFDPSAPQSRTFGEILERSERLARVLDDLGVGEGDRVATLCWNHAEHMEAYVAVPSMGAVLLTLNLRLHADQLRQIVSHAQPRVLVVDRSLLELARAFIEETRSLQHVLVVGDSYDEAVAATEPGFEWPEIEERAAAAMCYTTGTTGLPKGVVYSHRSTYLHSLACAAPNAFGLGERDRILLVVPMFHAAGWGLPYTALFMGCDLLMPREFLQGQHLAAFIEAQRATFAAGVPTVLDDLLREGLAAGRDLSSLRLLIGGGAAVPPSLIERWARAGVELVQGWGMTETSPLAALAWPPRGDEDDLVVRARTGRPIHGVELRIVDDQGTSVPADGLSVGELEVRGPWVTGGYYKDPAPERFHDEWLRTGDVGFMDERGYVQITDRLKDVIKSGGEWISSIDLEKALSGHPAVREAAVIGVPDERWTERPLALIVSDRQAAAAEDLRGYLADRVARWWIPERWAFVNEIPKTSVGKIDKKLLRQQAADGTFEVVWATSDKPPAATSTTPEEQPRT
jgi:fatty-acyl-CoA synthase